MNYKRRVEEKIQDKIAKELNDLVVQYAFYVRKKKTKAEKKELFDEYNEIWIQKCFNMRNNKYVELSPYGFKTIAGNPIKLAEFQEKLGIKPDKISLWRRLLSFL